MDGILRQNTAVDIFIGPFIDDTDGKTAETALTLAQAAVRLSKNAQNMAQKSDVTSCVHDELGMYNCELDATDTDTVGILTVNVHQAGSLAIKHTYQVLDEVAYDSLFAVAATILTAQDVGLMYESTIATLNSQTSFDMTDAFASDDVGIGNLVTIVDAGNSANFHSTWITDLDQVNERILTNDAPAGWTIATTDTVRIYRDAHPGYHANAQINANDPLKKDAALAWMQLFARKDVAIGTDRAAALAELNANQGSGVGAYDQTSDSQESQRDNMATTADLTAVKAKTDQFVFTISGRVDANGQYLNDGLVYGTGTSGDEWRGTP